MSATISLYLRNELLRYYFMNRPDSSVFAAVTTTVGLANSPGDLLVEPAAGYARVELPCDTDTWTLSGFGEVYNIISADFPAMEDDWGYLSGWAILDAPTSGMTLAVGSLIVPGFVTADMPPVSLDVGGCPVGLYD